jgi:Mn-containing catalase
MMALDGEDGSASVELEPDEERVLTALAARTQSAPEDVITGVELGAGPGAGRTAKEDFGGAEDIDEAVTQAKERYSK